MNISYAVYPIQYCPRDLDGDVSDGTRVIAPKCVHSAHECTRKHTVTIWVSSNKKNRELHSNCFGSGLDFNFTVIFCRGALTSPSKCPKNIPAKILEECVQVLKGVRFWYILAFGFCLISRLPRIWCEGTQMDALFISLQLWCLQHVYLFIYIKKLSCSTFPPRCYVLSCVWCTTRCNKIHPRRSFSKLSISGWHENITHQPFFFFSFFFFRNSAIQAIWPIYTFLTLMSSDEQTHFQMLHVFMVAIFTLKIVSNPTFCLPSLTFCSKWIYALWIFM